MKYEKYNSFNNKTEEKGMLWILISIIEKTFHDVVLEIYNQNLDKKFYDKNSLIIIKKNEILNLTKKLKSIHLIEMEIFDDYLKFKNNLIKQQPFKIKEEPDEEELFLSPFHGSKEIDKNYFFANLEPIGKKTSSNNFYSMFFSKSSIKDETEFLKNNNNNINYGNNIGLESIFLAMDDDNHVEDNNNKERKPTIEKINNNKTNNNKNNNYDNIKNKGNNFFNPPEREIF
jgi:hypothetical protein